MNDLNTLSARLPNAANTVDAVGLHLTALVSDPKFFSLISAVYDEDAVEGSLYYDDVAAAMMIRAHAIKTADTAVATAKLKTVRSALNAAMARLGVSREQRRQAA